MIRTSAAALLLVTLTACGGDDAPVRQARPETPTTPVVGPPPGCPSGTVRLTFDDGPHPEVTPRVLDVLAAYDAKATFFVVGSAVSHNPDIVERAHAEGHSIQNHTWSHPTLTELPLPEVETELSRTSDIVGEVTGERPTEWRPPFEEYNPAVEQVAKGLGMMTVVWDYETDTNDWKGGSADDIAATVLDNAKNGSIILAHDTFDTTVEAMPEILDGLHTKGFCTSNS